jgi:DNA repair protein RadC
MDIKKGYIGRSAYRFFTRKNNPVRPDTAKQTDLLAILLADRRSAESIMEHAKGDLRNLDGIELKELVALPKVGEAAAAKIVSLFALIEHLLSRPLQPSDSDG